LFLVWIVISPPFHSVFEAACEPLRALTIFFWLGGPEVGFGVALEKGC